MNVSLYVKSVREVVWGNDMSSRVFTGKIECIGIVTIPRPNFGDLQNPFSHAPQIIISIIC